VNAVPSVSIGRTLFDGLRDLSSDDHDLRLHFSRL
jgi:hypothetical protein